MPAFNGTGPLGRGPFTGKGQGYCIGQIDEVTYRGIGRGLGVGRGQGAGRGRRNCRYIAERPFRAVPAYVSSPGAENTESQSQELELLRERVKNLEAALEQVTQEREQSRVAD